MVLITVSQVPSPIRGCDSFATGVVAFTFTQNEFHFPECTPS
ncbi:rCG33923 [Rattus norvegicus]|uniref:RCG33923 n=1 Tax=Rattus norvegicus TaxID=10116 RepID=A6HI04_RAT|nr:rCG33923 [Rattus norvegicus]